MPKLVYLAGPISGCTYDGAMDWRNAAARVLEDAGIIALSPMRGKAYLDIPGQRIDGQPEAYRGVPLSAAKGIVTRDRWDCQRADVILMYLKGAERISIGSMIEMGWADSARVPVVLVLEPGNVHEHAMLVQLAGFVVETLDEALHVVIQLLG